MAIDHDRRVRRASLLGPDGRWHRIPLPAEIMFVAQSGGGEMRLAGAEVLGTSRWNRVSRDVLRQPPAPAYLFDLDRWLGTQGAEVGRGATARQR